MDTTEKEQLAQEQMDQLREALKQKHEITNPGGASGTQGVELTETHYDPHAQLTFGTGKYSNTVIGGGYNNTSPYYTSSSSAGITYTVGTGTGINNPWASTTTTAGAISAKDVILDGVSLKQILEERLNVMIPNPELEKEWDQLKELGDQYRALEKDLKEKAEIWKKLNG